MSLLPPPSGAAKTFTVPPLTCSRRDGRPYQRRADIEEKIIAMLQVGSAEWMGYADDLPAEVLVYLIRDISNRDAGLAGNLIFKLTEKIHPVVRRWARGFGRIETEEILHTINQAIIELVLAEEPSRQTEILEIAFSKSVKRRTLNEVEKAKARPSSARKTIEASDAPEEADDRLGPLEQILEVEDAAHAVDLIRKAQLAVKDLRHYEALLLHYGHGWPIDPKNQDQPSLAKHFGVSGRQIQNWLAAGLENIRTTLGVGL